MEVTLGYLLKRNAFKFPNKEAIVYGDRRIRYGEFNFIRQDLQDKKDIFCLSGRKGKIPPSFQADGLLSPSSGRGQSAKAIEIILLILSE